jgi:hypothetical protein
MKAECVWTSGVLEPMAAQKVECDRTTWPISNLLRAVSDTNQDPSKLNQSQS